MKNLDVTSGLPPIGGNALVAGGGGGIGSSDVVRTIKALNLPRSIGIVLFNHTCA